jgi:hypothetical protein
VIVEIFRKSRGETKVRSRIVRRAGRLGDWALISPCNETDKSGAPVGKDSRLGLCRMNSGLGQPQHTGI